MGFVSSLVSYRFFTLICRQYTQQSQTDVTLCQSLRKTQVVVYSACAVLNSHGLGYLEIAINLRKWVENGTRIQSQFDPLAYYSIHTTIMCNFKNFLNMAKILKKNPSASSCVRVYRVHHQHTYSHDYEHHLGYLWPVACLRTLRELPFIFLKNLTTKDALEHAFNVTWTTNVFIIASDEQVFICGSSGSIDIF